MLAPVFGVSALHCVCTRYVPVYVPPPMLHRLCTTSYVVHIMYHVSTVELYGRSEADSFLVGIERERTRILVDQWTAVYVTPARAPRLKCLDLIQSPLFPEGSRERVLSTPLCFFFLRLQQLYLVCFQILLLCTEMRRGVVTWLLFSTCLTTALACTTSTEDRSFSQIQKCPLFGFVEFCC